jgi:hypothetical protein
VPLFSGGVGESAAAAAVTAVLIRNSNFPRQRAIVASHAPARDTQSQQSSCMFPVDTSRPLQFKSDTAIRPLKKVLLSSLVENALREQTSLECRHRPYRFNDPPELTLLVDSARRFADRGCRYVLPERAP